MSEQVRSDVACIRIRTPGDPDVLEFTTRTLPPPAAEEVRVRVTASGVNRADLLQRRGLYPAPPGYDDALPGLEYAGTVAATGPGCRLRSVGDRVMGVLSGGGYSAAVNVWERETISVPEGVSLVDAAAIPEAFLTAWDALVGQARLEAGETVLIHAVGSGVGTAAVQLARDRGARTIGTSRTPSKVERARGIGLDIGVVSPGDDDAGSSWSDRVCEALGAHGARGMDGVDGADDGTAGRSPVDVILDLVGGDYMAENLRVLGHRGRWIVVGVPGGTTGTLDLRALMAARGRIQGTLLRARPIEEKATLARAFERTVVPRFESGHLKPVVAEVIPAPRAAEAHRIMEANGNWGKLLLRWS